MIYFSFSGQAFFDSELNYLEIPADIIEITTEQHAEILDALNRNCLVFSDLTFSEPKPSPFHEWNGAGWVDSRTPEEIAFYNHSFFPQLSKRQFALYLYDHNMYDQVMQAIEENPRFKIEYDSVSDIERLSPMVSDMTTLLGWTDEQVDQMWEQASTL